MLRTFQKKNSGKCLLLCQASSCACKTHNFYRTGLAIDTILASWMCSVSGVGKQSYIHVQIFTPVMATRICLGYKYMASIQLCLWCTCIHCGVLVYTLCGFSKDVKGIQKAYSLRDRPQKHIQYKSNTEALLTSYKKKLTKKTKKTNNNTKSNNE